MATATLLPNPARYAPYQSGRYSLAPGLHRLGTDFGNGVLDARLWQIDSTFLGYRANKLARRHECLSRYVCATDPSPAVLATAERMMMVRLATEYPDQFTLTMASGGAGSLASSLTGDTLHFDTEMRLTGCPSPNATPAPPYTDLWDALVCQVPEDVALVEFDTAGGTDRLTALHLCAPSHWAADDKVGKGFNAVHAPVPHQEKTRTVAPALLQTIVQRGPFVRFAWGIEDSDQLNQHPHHTDPVRFADPAKPLFVRVERQTLWGLPDANALLFAIRVYVTPVAELVDSERVALRLALGDMSEETRRYKGMTTHFDSIVTRLSSW